MKTNPARPTSGSRRRILLVDDQPLFREGLTQWIRRTSDLEKCAEAGTAILAMQLVPRHKPDLVLCEISLPDRNGIEFLKGLRDQCPRIPVLVLSIHDEKLYAGRALRTGARGYLMKRADGPQIMQAVREVLAGRIALSREMATELLEEYSGVRTQSGRAGLPQLTDREFEVLSLLGDAKSNREVAGMLHLSPKTVESHRLNLMQKLKVKTGAQLMRYAIQYAEGEVFGNGNHAAASHNGG
jgi:DNA-binding NarL/FixJ family response regulator